jgi:hypothetical protein
MSRSNAGRRFIPPLARLEGAFLESMLPVRAFAQLTAQHRMAQLRLEGLFSGWIQGVQAHNRVTLGWLMSIEMAPQPHLHAALIAAVPLDCFHAASFWQAMVASRNSGSAQVAPYRPGLCGIGYVLKHLGSSTEQIRLSDNITAFADTGGKSQLPTNPVRRRQQRRIRAQIEKAAR